MLNTLLWYFWVQAFAFGGWLVAKRWLLHLPDRGYGLSKALGLLLGGYFYWMLVTLRWAQNNIGAVLLALALVYAIGLWLHRNQSRVSSLRPAFPTLHAPILTEILFALSFALYALYRSYNADIISAGGEKYMESLMTNAILRSSHFPPNDAWLSGFPISYYYFGYVIFAMLTRASGVPSAVAFNLGGAMILALTLVSAFSIGYNLYESKRQYEKDKMNAGEPPSAFFHLPFSFQPVAAGLITAIMLCLMGNMGGLMGVLRCGNVLHSSVWQWLDIRDIANTPTQCDGLRPSSHFYAWWWDWSRVVKDYAPDGINVQEVITETPIFSFVLGDNHPHTLALPFVLIAIGIAISHTRSDNGRRTTDDGTTAVIAPNPPFSILQSIFLPALVAGGLAFLNTWDFPIYSAIIIGGAALGNQLSGKSLVPPLMRGAAMLALAYALYLPFHATFSSQARGIGVNLFNATRLPQFLLMFAPFIVAFVGFVVLQVTQTPQRKSLLTQTISLTVAAVGLSLLASVVFGVLSPQGRGLWVELNTTGTALGVPRTQIESALLKRAANPWTALALCLGIASCTALFLKQLRHADPVTRKTEAASPPHPHLHTYTLIPLALFALGAALILVPEFIFLQDLFGTRMNTVFKFYYQAWTLWAIAAGFAITSLFAAKALWARAVGAATLLLVLAGLLYPLLAAISKTDNFAAQTPTLDGAAYLQNSHPDDAKAIAWLNANVPGDPIIVEKPDGGSYNYEGRIAAFTGLPTVLGWGGHQNQWRGNYDEPGQRQPAIEAFYNTTDSGEARNFIKRYNVTYVIVGEAERNSYNTAGLAKFDSLCGVAFESANTKIFKCQ